MKFDKKTKLVLAVLLAFSAGVSANGQDSKDKSSKDDDIVSRIKSAYCELIATCRAGD